MSETKKSERLVPEELKELDMLNENWKEAAEIEKLHRQALTKWVADHIQERCESG